jgi:histidinol dehydrogenase
MDALEASEAEFAAAEASVDRAFRDAVETAITNIRSFHEAERPRSWSYERDGARLGQRVRPLDRVGIHVPAGKAPLPSTLLMAAVPARVAGVREVIVCTPPQGDGSANPYTLFAARAAGVDRFFKVGGAQAGRRMAFGRNLSRGWTRSSDLGTRIRCSRSGSCSGTWISRASRADGGAGHRGRDGEPALDAATSCRRRSTARTAWRSPHPQRGAGPRGGAEVARQTPLLSATRPPRPASRPRVGIVTRDLAEACELSNRCAPEHLELVVADPDQWLDHLHHAGRDLRGGLHAGAGGRLYRGAESHPTDRRDRPLRFAAQPGRLREKTSIIHYSRERFEREAAHVIRLAEAETLDGHANAIRVRLEAADGA